MADGWYGELPEAPVVTAANVNVAADATNGISADDLQAVLSALAARIKAVEDAQA